MTGGHGELVVQQFGGSGVESAGDVPQSPARRSGSRDRSELVVGSGARQLVDARGWGVARDAWPSAANALKMPPALRALPPKPVYARAPDARPKQAA